MTTTKYRDRIIALRELARGAATAHEADTALAMARKLCLKHDIDTAILDAQPEPQRVADPYGFGTFVKKYPCRFGCGAYVQHTIEELNVCAEKARNASTTGNAYGQQSKPQEDPFADWFADFARKASQNTRNAPPRNDHEPKARANGTHAYCSHEATKSARARCRKDRGY